MKKKIIMILLMILFGMCFYFPIGYAASMTNVKISSTKKRVEKEQEIEMILQIENGRTAAFTSYLYFDSNKLEYVAGPENTNVVDNRVIYVWYDPTGGSGAKEGKLAKFTFQAKQEGMVTFQVGGEFYNQQGELLNVNFEETHMDIGKQTNSSFPEEITKTDFVESSNTNLEILALENILLNPNFDPDETHYTAEVSHETETINLLTIPEDEKATVEVEKKEPLVEGKNSIHIMVTAANGFNQKSYQVEIYKRNQLEEQIAEEERKLQKEKLEQAYQISQLSTKEQEEKPKRFGNKFFFLAMIPIGIIFMIKMFYKCDKFKKVTKNKHLS